MPEGADQLSNVRHVESTQHNESARVVLSIVIVHYKTLDFTFQCISSIYAHAPKIPFEVVLVDNGSQDGIEDGIAGHFPNVRFIEAGRNLGFTGGNNLGIYNSHGEFIVLLNSDAKLIEFSLDAMLHYLRSHPEVGILGPRHVDSKNRFQLSFGHFPTLISEIVRKLVHSQLSIGDNSLVRDYLDGRYSSTSMVDWVSGSCLMVRRQTLEQIGLLDERIFMYFEDIDLCTRARRAGWFVHYYPYTSVLHHGGQSAKINLMDALTSYRKSQIYFTKKYYGFFSQTAIRFLIAAKYGLHFFRWGLAHIIYWLSGRNLKESYTSLLLSKKVVFIAFGSIPRPSQEPALKVQKPAAISTV
jgi:GT2 family glycosyltransferase